MPGRKVPVNYLTILIVLSISSQPGVPAVICWETRRKRHRKQANRLSITGHQCTSGPDLSGTVRPGSVGRVAAAQGNARPYLLVRSALGGSYRMALIYDVHDHATPGKTSEHTDVVQMRFIDLVQDQRIVQKVEFESDDAAFAGTRASTRYACQLSSTAKRGQVGVARVPRTVDLRHIPQAIELLFVLGGRLIIQGRVHARAVVEGLDVVEHREPSGFA